jgi:DNA-binding CsgD family transcriptional regulator
MPKRISQDVLKLGSDMLQFTSSIETLGTPDEVLDCLHKVTLQATQLNVLGAALFPLRWGDWSSLEKGKTVFLHKGAPEGWWDDAIELSRKHPGLGFMFAHMSLAPFTMSELIRMLEPLGVDRWSFDLAIKYGMRDRLDCPVGGRWVVSFWSRKVLSQVLSEEARAILFMGATFAAIRLQKLVGPQVGRIGKGAALTARELAVLRLLSLGHPIREVAALLELGGETVRSHLKKAEAKLGVHDRSHAVAQAIRHHLIP